MPKIINSDDAMTDPDRSGGGNCHHHLIPLLPFSAIGARGGEVNMESRSVEQDGGENDFSPQKRYRRDFQEHPVGLQVEGAGFALPDPQIRQSNGGSMSQGYLYLPDMNGSGKKIRKFFLQEVLIIGIIQESPRKKDGKTTQENQKSQKRKEEGISTDHQNSGWNNRGIGNQSILLHI